ncbi:MAG: molybdopterin converting factor subunit 1 [Thiotrichales bacterium]
MINVKYFASLREQLGKEKDELSAVNVDTVADVWNLANPGECAQDNLLVAINQEYAQLDSEVNDGDEVAFFPPVTGG